MRLERLMKKVSDETGDSSRETEETVKEIEEAIPHELDDCLL